MKVKQEPVSPSSRTRVSSKHQVTIGKQAFRAAGLKPGDAMTVRAVGPGRVELTRLDTLFEKHRGRIEGGDDARQAIERMREAWT
jgi:bifunctional DNA-binding transcriptional regulator/antitoxin component of YhaV-PrlF toxin-antitoxin module